MSLTIVETFDGVEARATWDADVMVEDRRVSPRVPRSAATTLVCPRGGTVLSCSLRDLSEGGIYVYAPPGANLMLGERYEIMVAPDRKSATFGDWSEGLFATVVRTEFITRDNRPALGAGMRFDQPVLL